MSSWPKQVNFGVNQKQTKKKPYRDKEYLRWLDNGICKVCYCGTPTHHHIRRHKWGAGLSQKPHDYVCVRRCDVYGCHDPKNDNLFGCETEIIENLTSYFVEKYGEDELIEILMKELDNRRQK